MRPGRSPTLLLSVFLSAFALLAGLWAATPAGAGTANIILSPSVGPPTTKFTITGSGFGGNEVVDLYADGGLLNHAVADATGAFTKNTRIPARVPPGTHTIRATGESSGLSASTQFLVRTDWAKFRFDNANSGYNPYENVLSPLNVAGLVEAWSVTINVSGVSSPVVSNGIVYVGLGDNVSARAAATGAEVWSFPTGGGIESAPTVASGVVYVGSYDNNVYALEASTGAELWSFATG